MKRSASGSNISEKKVRFAEQTMDNNVKSDLSPHHFNLGGENLVKVSDYCGLSIHIRKFWKNAGGFYVPTKKGVTLTPFLWQSLANNMNSMDLHPSDEKPEILENCLMLSATKIGGTPHIVIQRYYQRKDLLRYFAPTACILSENEWNTLKELRQDITNDAITVMFSRVFPKLVMNAVAMKPRTHVSEINEGDAELALTAVLMHLLSSHIKMQINRLRTCHGCEVGYENQLGHECITSNYSTLFSCYGESAILSIDIELLATEFVAENAHCVNFITPDFMNNLNVHSLIKTAEEMYIQSDPNPNRLF